MVTSAAPSEGKTTTSANLAVAFAEAGASVLLVNCDFRRPTLHKYFGVEQEPRRIHPTQVPGVRIITNVLADPSANPAQVVAEQRRVIQSSRRHFDVVVVDTVPVLAANDTVELIAAADVVVFAEMAGYTTATNVTRALELLTRVGAPISGVVLVRSGEAQTHQYYYDPRAAVPAGASTGARHGQLQPSQAPPRVNGVSSEDQEASTNGLVSREEPVAGS